MDIEYNKNNPTIARVEQLDIRHHFVIRYLDENMKKQMRELIMLLINEHEISDFYIEERKAFKTNRIIYNLNTIADDNNFNFTYVNKNFTKYLH